MIDQETATAFLTSGRLAVVGASDDQRNFGNAVYRALRDHDIETVAVNPRTDVVAGDPSYPDLASVPGTIDGVIVMVGRDKAADVVRACIDYGVRRVWLFRGLGGPGALSDEAVKLCHDHGVEVVAGACPFMFLEPVGWFHKTHRTMRRLNGSLARAS